MGSNFRLSRKTSKKFHFSSLLNATPPNAKPVVTEICTTQPSK